MEGVIKVKRRGIRITVAGGLNWGGKASRKGGTPGSVTRTSLELSLYRPPLCAAGPGRFRSNWQRQVEPRLPYHGSDSE
eukprot:749750-Hanusia_phi.AAC.3